MEVIWDRVLIQIASPMIHRSRMPDTSWINWLALLFRLPLHSSNVLHTSLLLVNRFFSWNPKMSLRANYFRQVNMQPISNLHLLTLNCQQGCPGITGTRDLLPRGLTAWPARAAVNGRRPLDEYWLRVTSASQPLPSSGVTKPNSVGKLISYEYFLV